MRLFVRPDKSVPEAPLAANRDTGSPASGATVLASSPRRNTQVMLILPRQTSDREVVVNMTVRGTHRAVRQRKRVRQRKIGVALALVGVLVWVSFVVLRFATEDLLSDSLLYLGITVGGAAVVAGIILITTTF
jgi:hypothetical protein